MSTERPGFEDVVEAHRKKIGAERLHVSLGPDATPEGLAAELDRLDSKLNAYAAFSDLEREQARSARLREIIGDIAELTRRPLVMEKGDAERRLSEIFLKADLIADVDLEVDIAWMTAQRDAAGIPLPF